MMENIHSILKILKSKKKQVKNNFNKSWDIRTPFVDKHHQEKGYYKVLQHDKN